MGNKAKDRRFKRFKEQEVEIGIHDMYPKFSFEFCFGNKRSIEKANKLTKYAVISKLIYLSKLTWKAIQDLPKEQGFEKLDKAIFKTHPNIPNKFANEKSIDVCRIPGGKGRIIGYIEEEIFFIVWIDTEFNMYPHK